MQPPTTALQGAPKVRLPTAGNENSPPLSHTTSIAHKATTTSSRSGVDRRLHIYIHTCIPYSAPRIAATSNELPFTTPVLQQNCYSKNLSSSNYTAQSRRGNEPHVRTLASMVLASHPLGIKSNNDWQSRRPWKNFAVSASYQHNHCGPLAQTLDWP